MAVATRSSASLASFGLTVLALIVLATARLPDPVTVSAVPALREGGPTTNGPSSRGVLLRLGLGGLLVAALAIRLRDGRS
jgi:hypothetical protein